MLKTYPEVFQADLDGSLKVVDVADATDSLSQTERQHDTTIARYDYDGSRIKVTSISVPAHSRVV